MPLSSLNNHPEDWVAPTRLLDLDDPKLRIQAMRITQLATTDMQKAILVHDFVKALPFGCVAGFDHVPAVSVLKTGHGDCHTKGTLFVALLRCAGVPARLRFVTLTGAFLHGIIDIGQTTITHAVGEVYLQERWVQTDTYVTDSILEAQAMSLLSQHNISVGYGIHKQGNRFWNTFLGNSSVNDVGFIRDLLDTLQANYNIDQNRIYSTGMSNGGFMSYSLACQLNDRITAIASVTGSMIQSKLNACNPVRPVHWRWPLPLAERRFVPRWRWQWRCSR